MIAPDLPRPGSTARPVALLTALGLTIGLAILYAWFRSSEAEQTAALARHEARAFFQQILLTRSWNALHGGVYVFVSPQTQPNPHLTDPDRDLRTEDGRRLTKINPAYMTRQLSELAGRHQIQFHITSLQPVRPANACDAWEKQALLAFQAGEGERTEFISVAGGEPVFRYMAPLWVERSCLACHAAQGYREGDLRGGISVSVPAAGLLDTQAQHDRRTAVALGLIWGVGLAGIALGYRRVSRAEAARERVIQELQGALAQVKTLSGLLPICASCKKVRDDQGYWQQIENYISAHSQAEFTHGICPECTRRLYPDFARRNGRTEA
jgi:hypothetical protein